MKEIYDWVPWFKELGGKIAAGGERYLIDQARAVAWKGDDSDPAILRYGEENIDPFSFVYTVASLNRGDAARNRVYSSISRAFDLSSQLDLESEDGLIFPTPPAINALFHDRGQGNPELMWRLFRDALAGFESVKPDEFAEALSVPKVATKKLTQALFLVNPDEFLPVDDQTGSLGFFESVPKTISLQEYGGLLSKIRAAFPRCRPYEANLFAYLLSSNRLKIDASNVFQVSTNAYNDGRDRWNEFDSGNCVFVGGLGDKRKYPIADAKPGDLVLVRFGRSEGRGIGVVYRNDYQGEFDKAHRLHVLWLNKEHGSLPKMTTMLGFGRAGETTESFRQTREYVPTFEMLDRLSAEERSEAKVSVGSDTTGPDFPLNQILYGPPGTGKTWRTRDLSLEIVGEAVPDAERNRRKFDELRFDPRKGTGRIAMVTFHQNVAYEDFIEGIRPALGEQGTLAYEMRPGIFRHLVKEAEKRGAERFVLIIDEINRGNVAKIFGELITLLEDSRRIGREDETHVTLPYSGQRFGIPKNIYVIGTMNTADRSIQLLDTALRRRFTFVEMMPNPEHPAISRDIDGIDCTELLKAMNERIAALLDREHQIGHTYLLGVDTIGKLSDAMRNRIFPLLQEYFFDDWAKIRAVLGRSPFVTTRQVPNLRTDPDAIEEAREVFGRLPNEDPAWEDAGQYRKIYEEDVPDETDGS